MKPEITEFLNLAEKPYRLTMEQTASQLGFAPHEISILIARGLLRPLGHPAHNGQKFFLTAALEELRRDEKWFSKASDAVSEYWRYKNSRKGQESPIMNGDGRRGATAPELADAED